MFNFFGHLEDNSFRNFQHNINWFIILTPPEILVSLDFSSLLLILILILIPILLSFDLLSLFS